MGVICTVEEEEEDRANAHYMTRPCYSSGGSLYYFFLIQCMLLFNSLVFWDTFHGRLKSHLTIMAWRLISRDETIKFHERYV